jgi:hypothetical protein
MNVIRRSRFVYGGGDFTTELSAHPWIPADSTVGGDKVSAAGIPASYIVRRDNLMEVTLRVQEDEWETFLSLIAFGQSRQTFTWYPDSDEGANFTVYLESPLAGERWAPTRLGGFERVYEIPIVLRGYPGVNIYGEYFAEEPAGPVDQEIVVVTVTPNTVSSPVGSTQLLIGQALNVSVQTVPSDTVTWSSGDTTVATVSDNLTSDGLTHEATITGAAVGGTTVYAYVNGVQSNPVTVTVTSAPAGTLYWDDDQAGGVFGPDVGGYGWGTLSGGAYNPAPSVVADADSPTGYAVRFRFNPTTGGSRTEGRIDFGAQLTEVYIGWNIKFPTNYFHRNGPSSDNNKMIRAWGGAYSAYELDGDTGPGWGFSAYPSPSTGGGSFMNFSGENWGANEGNGHKFIFWSPTGVGGVNLATDLGFYRRWVVHLKAASGPGMNDGVIEWWSDGVIKWSKTGDYWDYSPVTHNYIDQMYLLGAANSGFNVVTDIMIQNVKIGATYADVA